MEMVKHGMTMLKMLGMYLGGTSFSPPLSNIGGKADDRPMSLAISNAKNVVIKNFSVIQPQFWASIIIESENVLIQDFYVNATSYNPSVSLIGVERA
jgi:polygalacturonase